MSQMKDVDHQIFAWPVFKKILLNNYFFIPFNWLRHNKQKRISINTLSIYLNHLLNWLENVKIMRRNIRCYPLNFSIINVDII